MLNTVQQNSPAANAILGGQQPLQERPKSIFFNGEITDVRVDDILNSNRRQAYEKMLAPEDIQKGIKLTGITLAFSIKSDDDPNFNGMVFMTASTARVNYPKDYPLASRITTFEETHRELLRFDFNLLEAMGGAAKDLLKTMAGFVGKKVRIKGTLSSKPDNNGEYRYFYSFCSPGLSEDEFKKIAAELVADIGKVTKREYSQPAPQQSVITGASAMGSPSHSFAAQTQIQATAAGPAVPGTPYSEIAQPQTAQPLDNGLPPLPPVNVEPQPAAPVQQTPAAPAVPQPVANPGDIFGN